MTPAPPGQPEQHGFTLVTDSAGRLCARATHHPEQGPVCIDWDRAELRRRIAAGRRQPLARALGLRRLPEPQIADLTAGFGRDGFVLAALGARVTMVERQRLVHALLSDALVRALDDPALRASAERIQLVHADAHQWLRTAGPLDAAYLDPMYPDTARTALPAKELQWLRELTGGDGDAGALLEPARAVAGRVAVKRARHAWPLAGVRPQAVIRTTQLRFDLYFAAGVK